jgi:dTDP-4-amino-4,6-dideoxygalactose transaminase
MSEYHAAVGLAELDEWTTKLEALEAVADLYRRVVGGKGLADRLVTQPDIGASYVLLQSPDAASRRAIESRLDAVGVEHRLWYGEGLHRNEYFSALPRDGLPVTERLGATVLGLPLAPDLDEEAVARVAGALVDS